MHAGFDVEKWGNSHRSGFLDIFRIMLGLFILYKGLYFLTHLNDLKLITSGLNAYVTGTALAHYIVLAHCLGGPLLTCGLFTRAVSAIQLPILIGAVFLVNDPQGHLSLNQYMELWSSLAVLAGLLILIVFGAGSYSLDARRRNDIDVTHPL